MPRPRGHIFSCGLDTLACWIESCLVMGEQHMGEGKDLIFNQVFDDLKCSLWPSHPTLCVVVSHPSQMPPCL